MLIKAAALQERRPAQLGEDTTTIMPRLKSWRIENFVVDSMKLEGLYSGK